MELPLYEIVPEEDRFRICLHFRGQLLPLPEHIFYNREIAELCVLKMQKEDLALWQQEKPRCR